MKSPKSTFRVLLATVFVIGTLCLLAVAGGWYYVLGLSKNVGTLSTEIVNMRKESSKLSELSIRYQRVLADKSVVYGAIPSTKDESSFMADLENMAKANGLDISKSTLGTSKSKSTKGSEFSQTVSKQEYYELPIAYEADTTYSSFTKFVSDLSSLRRLNSVDDITVTADTADKAAAGRVRVSFVVTIYVKK
jgi:Tfp pilus assembly protein PilO